MRFLKGELKVPEEGTDVLEVSKSRRKVSKVVNNCPRSPKMV